jgi:hypothetical protein
MRAARQLRTVAQENPSTFEHVNDNDVKRWFRDYLEVFESVGRGEQEPGALLGHYGVPLLITVRDTFMVQMSADEVVGVLRRQVEEMQAAGYHSTTLLDEEVAVLNAASALYRGTFSRRRADGSEISAITATYFVTDSAVGRRIVAFAVHDA